MRAQRKENFFERVISFVSHDCVKICETNVFCLEKTQITCEKQERQRMFCWEEICWFALLQTHFVVWILNDWKGLPSEPKPTFLKERIFFSLRSTSWHIFVCQKTYQIKEFFRQKLLNLESKTPIATKLELKH